MIFLILLCATAFADSYDEGIKKTLNLQQRAEGLLKKAGIAFNEKDSSSIRPEEKPTILNVHALPSSGFLPAGALAFGTVYFELLVGEESSPIEVRLGHDNKYSWMNNLKILGQATQSRGRVFIEFDRIITKKGTIIPIQGVALSEAGSLGIAGKNQNSKITEVIGGTALGLLAAPEEKSDLFGRAEESFKMPLGSRLKSSLLQESRNYLREQIKESPVLKIESGTPVTVLFKEEVRF